VADKPSEQGAVIPICPRRLHAKARPLDWDLQSHTAFTFSNSLFHTVFSFIFYFEVSCASFFLLIKITASLLPFRSKKNYSTMNIMKPSN
jgi:hypothetical protein